MLEIPILNTKLSILQAKIVTNWACVNLCTRMFWLSLNYSKFHHHLRNSLNFWIVKGGKTPTCDPQIHSRNPNETLALLK
jgi:hypothetical protein